MLFLLVLVFSSSSLLVSGASVFRQRYNNGTATLGGCAGGFFPNDNVTYPLGSCVAGNNSSIWFNDCWNNGLGSLTVYNGSTTCNSSFVSGSSIFATTRNGQSYCNVAVNQSTYNTFTCTDYTTPVITATPTQYITLTQYALPAASGCTGASVQLNLTVGQCSSVGGGTYVIANCANGMVTASTYDTTDCSVQYGTNGAINVSLSSFGPYSQLGAPSAAGKAVGAIGSDCAMTSQAYMQFTCFPNNVTLPTTPIPTGSSSSSSSSSSAGGSGSSTTSNSSSSSSTTSTTGTTSTTSTTSSTSTTSTASTTSSSSTGGTPANKSSSSSTGSNAASHQGPSTTWIWAITIPAIVGAFQITH